MKEVVEEKVEEKVVDGVDEQVIEEVEVKVEGKVEERVVEKVAEGVKEVVEIEVEKIKEKVKKKREYDVMGSIPFFIATIYISVLGGRKMLELEVNADTLLCISVSAYLFIFCEILTTFNVNKKLVGSIKGLSIIVLLYGLLLPSSYLPFFSSEYPANITDGLILIAVAGIVLSFAIKQLNKNYSKKII